MKNRQGPVVGNRVILYYFSSSFPEQVRLRSSLPDQLVCNIVPSCSFVFFQLLYGLFLYGCIFIFDCFWVYICFPASFFPGFWLLKPVEFMLVVTQFFTLFLQKKKRDLEDFYLCIRCLQNLSSSLGSRHNQWMPSIDSREVQHAGISILLLYLGHCNGTDRYAMTTHLSLLVTLTWLRIIDNSL